MNARGGGRRSPWRADGRSGRTRRRRAPAPTLSRPDERVERLEIGRLKAGLHQRRRRRRRRPGARRASRRSRPADRRARAATARRDPAVAGRAGSRSSRTASSDRFSAQNRLRRLLEHASSATSVFALRATAEAGLFSSCARPAASRPSDSHLLVEQLARLEHARAIEHHVHEHRGQLVALVDHPRQLRGIDARQVSCALRRRRCPGGALMREYGSMPVTSPPCHSMTMRGPAPRSTRIDR